MIMLMISYTISYHNISNPGSSIRSGSAAALCAPRGSGLVTTLPRLCRPDPALTDSETLTPDPLRLSDIHHPGTAPAVAPHPDVHLVEPASVAPVELRIGRGILKHCGSSCRCAFDIAMWNCNLRDGYVTRNSRLCRHCLRQNKGRCRASVDG